MLEVVRELIDTRGFVDDGGQEYEYANIPTFNCFSPGVTERTLVWRKERGNFVPHVVVANSVILGGGNKGLFAWNNDVDVDYTALEHTRVNVHITQRKREGRQRVGEWARNVWNTAWNAYEVDNFQLSMHAEHMTHS